MVIYFNYNYICYIEYSFQRKDHLINYLEKRAKYFDENKVEASISEGINFMISD